MPSRQPVTRDALRRELAFNAATKPLAIVAGAAVAVAALALGVGWLLLVALALYLALGLVTFLDAEEAERVGKRVYERARVEPAPERALPTGLAPEIAALLERARVEESRILRAIGESDLPFEQVSAEVEILTAEMERIAKRAQLISNYRSEERTADVQQRLSLLRSESGGSADTLRARERAAAALEDRLLAGEALDSELERFTAEMEHLIASLGVVHAQLVRMSVADEAGAQDEVAAQVRDLRERVGAVAETMGRAVAGLDSTGGR